MQSSDSNTDEEDIEQLKALLATKFHRGKGKFKGKLLIICFNCNEVGHIATRCTQKRTIEKETSTKIEKKMMEETTKTKEKSHTKLLMNMMIKRCMLQ